MKAKFTNAINSGKLFKNYKKESERSPDWKGEINVNGVEYWLSCWNKQTRNGNDYFSLSVRERLREEPTAAPEPAPDSSKGANPSPGDNLPFDDDIPF